MMKIQRPWRALIISVMKYHDQQPPDIEVPLSSSREAAKEVDADGPEEDEVVPKAQAKSSKAHESPITPNSFKCKQRRCLTSFNLA